MSARTGGLGGGGGERVKAGRRGRKVERAAYAKIIIHHNMTRGNNFSLGFLTAKTRFANQFMIRK